MKRALTLLMVIAVSSVATAAHAQKAAPTPLPLTPHMIPSPGLPAGDEPIFMQVKGQKSGVIIGDKDPQIQCVKLTHAVVSPRDAASGLPTGKRQHKPITCMVKGFSKPLVKLFGVLTKNENLPELKFSFGGARPTGRIDILNANVAAIETMTDATGTYYAISFTYQKITWTDPRTNTVVMDDWEAPVA